MMLQFEQNVKQKAKKKKKKFTMDSNCNCIFQRNISSGIKTYLFLASV